MVKFEDVKDQTTESFFNNNQFSIDAFNKKYSLGEGETYVKALKRVCDHVASVEFDAEKRKYWSERWFDEIYNGWWHPAGSIMQGAGSNKAISLMNCTHISMGTTSENEEWDSLEAIIKNTAYAVAKCASYRQGLGVDFSRLRPRGTVVNNSSKQSTGAVHWMKFIDSIGDYIGQCVHPDTNILTENGYQTIKNIVENKFSGHVFGTQGKTKVINWFKNPVKSIYRVKLEYGDYIDVSEDHKILTYNLDQDRHEIKAVKDLEIEDWVICSRQNIEENIEEDLILPEFNYKLHDYNDSNRLFVPSKIPKKMTRELAYILGIIYGDGCFYKDGVEIAFSNSWPDILDKFDQCMFKVFGCNVGDYGLHKKIGEKGTRCGDCTKITLGRWFGKFFSHIGFRKGKAHHLDFPLHLHICKKDILEHFFAGLFDSDGYNSSDKRNVCLSLVDGEFLYNLKRSMQKFGYVIKIRKKVKAGYSDVYNFSFVGMTSLKKLSKIASIKIMEGNILGKYDRLKTPYRARSLGLDYNKVNDINAEEPISDVKYTKYVGDVCNLYIQRIDSIEKREKSETYDITVSAEDHLYAAESCLISNSGRRPAFLFSTSCTHPDLEEFITCKSDYTKIQNANISVQCSNAFYEAVLANKDWELIFEIPELKVGQKVYIDVHSIDKDTLKDDKGYYYLAKRSRPYEKFSKVVKARKILEMIAQQMTLNAEPGIQNIDIARKYSNTDYLYDPKAEYDTRIIGTNACCFSLKSKVMVIRRKQDENKNYIIEQCEIKDVVKGDEIYSSPSCGWQKTPSGFFKTEPAQIWHLEFVNPHTQSITSFHVTENHKFEDAETGILKTVREIWNDFYTGKVFKISTVSEIEDEGGVIREPRYIRPLLLSSVSLGAVEEVGCIEIENSHRFWANGIISGNSEQYLSRDSLCVLASTNCGKFSTDPEIYKKELEVIAESINRFLDNVNECELVYETYATPHQKMAIKALRRTGAGYTNICDWLFKQNKQYGMEDGNDAIADFTKWYNYYLYKSSILLGKEKGSFGAFNRKKYEQSPFIQRMMDLGLKFEAMRNSNCSSIAPTGSLSLMFRDSVLSYGIEPSFGIYYWKRCRIAGKYEYYFNVPSVVRKTFEQAGFPIPMDSDTIKDSWDGKIGKKIVEHIEKYRDKIGIQFKDATQVKPLDKLDLMAKVMKWIDSSISVTYMLPEGTDWKEIYDFILEAYKREMKSIAAFPDRKMYGIVSYLPFKELAIKLINEGVEIHPQNFVDEELKQLNISKDNINVSNNAPKRLKTLEAELYYLSKDGENCIVAIGLQNGVPYEIFGGHIKGKDILWANQPKTAHITKIDKNHYKLVADNIEISNFGEAFAPIEQSLFRMISTMMRHGIPIQYMVEQLTKASKTMFSLENAVARVLKKYIKDGQKIVGKTCPSCKSTSLVYIEGCTTCSNCGWSKCS